MSRKVCALLTVIWLVAASSPTLAQAQESQIPQHELDDGERFSAEELDNLVGPVALYPDALLAQVLVAATFPDQVEEAARYVRANGTDGIDDQSWDVSVKAVAHYASALNTMADRGDWTTALGRAHALQSGDVMASVQRLRAMADRQGNLRSSAEMQVSRESDDYVIAPAQPRVIYVPTYDPYAVYRRPLNSLGFSTSSWSFGAGYPIGGWLNYDFNWPRRALYYNGWEPSYFGDAGGWRLRSRPYIQVTNTYVHPRYRNVYINRDVIRRRVIYSNLDRWPGVHRETRFSRRDPGYRGPQRIIVRSTTPLRGASGRYDSRYDRRSDGRYDGRYDSRDDRRGDQRYDGRYDRRDNRRSDGRTDRRDERRSDDGRYDGRYDSRSDGRYDGRYDGRWDARRDDRRPSRLGDGYDSRRDGYPFDDRGLIQRPIGEYPGTTGGLEREYDRRDAERGTTGSANRGYGRGSIGGTERSTDPGTIGGPDRGYDRGSIGGTARNDDPGTIGGGNRGDDRGRRGGGSDGREGRVNDGFNDRIGSPRAGMDSPMINPRRAERAPSGGAQGENRGIGGAGRAEGRGGRERPKF